MDSKIRACFICFFPFDPFYLPSFFVDLGFQFSFYALCLGPGIFLNLDSRGFLFPGFCKFVVGFFGFIIFHVLLDFSYV